MEVIRLNPSTFYGDAVVEGYSSMVWTERYLPSGDFEMRSPMTSNMRSLIPEDSLISLIDTDEVMIVDTHTIETDEAGNDELVATGRSYETVLEQRILRSMGGHGNPWQMPSAMPPYAAAAQVIWNAVCNTHSVDMTIATDYGVNALERIPNVAVSFSTQNTYGLDSFQTWWLEAGEVYPIVLDFLGRINWGIRCRRPKNNYDAVTYTQMIDILVNRAITIPAERPDSLWIDVYDGVDRSMGQDVRPKISFDYESGDLEGIRYLFSNKNLKNIAHVSSPIGNVDVYADDAVSPYLAGMARRLMYLDGGSPGNIPLEEFVSAMVQKGEVELAKQNRIALMEASIAATSMYKYNLDYRLGDWVTLTGDYDFKQKMLVNEYVRTEDSNGDHGYPMLALG